MNRAGTVVRIDERRGKVEVDAGGLCIEVDAAALRRADETGPTGAASPGGSGAGVAQPAPAPHTPAVIRRPASVPPQLNLIGLRVDEALRKLETYLNEACLAGLSSVRIIHGHGTGALREAVRSHLKKHPLIESFRFGEAHEGGRGATVALLK